MEYVSPVALESEIHTVFGPVRRIRPYLQCIFGRTLGYFLLTLPMVYRTLKVERLADQELTRGET